MLLIDVRDSLSARHWEDALPRRGGLKASPSGTVVLDISRVRWVEPDTAVRAILVVERALLEGASVVVRMPRVTPSTKERVVLDRSSAQNASDSDRNTARHVHATISRRQLAAQMLELIGFERALTHVHLREYLESGKLQIVRNYDFHGGEGDLGSTRAPGESDDGGPEPPPQDLHYAYTSVIFPLTWVSNPQGSAGRQHLDSIVQMKVLVDRMGHPFVSSRDLVTLAYVFIKELAENTASHSDREFALMAAWRRPDYVPSWAQESLEAEMPYVEWSRSRSAVEMTIGDSGQGIPSHLSDAWRNPTRGNQRAAIKDWGEPSSAEASRRLTGRALDDWTNDQVMAWAFERWSTSGDMEDLHRGTRGLYRVRRVVQSYSGLITLRCERSLVGMDFGQPPTVADGPRGRIVCQNSLPPGRRRKRGHQKLAWSPGTVVHLKLPMLSVPDSLKAAATQHPGPRPRKKVKLLRVDVTQPVPGMCEQMRRACVGAHQEGIECLAADFGFRVFPRTEMTELLKSILLVTNPVLVVVTNAALREGLAVLDGIIEATSIETLATADERGDPFLFRKPDHTYALVGFWRDTDQSSFFKRLLADGSLTYDELMRSQRSGAEVATSLRASDHLVELVQDPFSDRVQFELKFTPEYIESQLPPNRLLDLIETVYMEKDFEYRMPSGEVTGAFVNFPKLIRDLEEREKRGLEQQGESPEPLGLSDICYALADKAGAALLEWDGQGLVSGSVLVVADMFVPYGFVQKFRLQLIHRLSQVASGVSILRLGKGDQAAPESEGQIVVILADVVHSLSTTKRLSSQLAEHGFSPALVACMVDARPNKGGDPSPSVEFNGAEVSLVSLCSIDVRLRERRRPIKYVSPVDLSIERIVDPGTAAEEQLMVVPPATTAFLAWTREAGAAYRGHLVQPRGRHFPWYVDVLRVLQERTDEVIDIFHKAVTAWSDSDKVDLVKVDLVVYPAGGDAPISRKIAEGLASCLKEEDAVPVETLAPHPLGYECRATADHVPSLFPNPEAPPAEDPARSRGVVIVDWGSMTGATIRLMARSLAEKYQRILVVILLSQAPVHDELFLTAVTRVRNSRGTESALTVKYLVRLRVPVYDDANCPHCLQLSELKADASSPQTRLLRDYAEKLRKSHELRGVQLGDLRDAPGGFEPAMSASILSILELRDLIDTAETVTEKRFALLQRLRKIEEEVSARRELLWLLSTEWTLLRRSPLDLPKFRDLIAKIATSGAMDEDSLSDDRRRAVVVLRRASKASFAKHFKKLFERAWRREFSESHERGGEEDPIEVTQLLYCAWTMLRGRHRLPMATAALAKALGAVAGMHTTWLLKKGDHKSSQGVARTLGTLDYYSRVQQEDGQALAHRPQKCTLGDLRDWKVFHNGISGLLDVTASQSASRILWSMSPSGLAEDRFRDLGKWFHLWEPVADRLVQLRAFRVLARSRDRLSVLDIDPPTLEWLLSREGGFLLCLSGFAHHLSSFAAAPEHAREDAIWRNFQTAWDGLWRYAFDPGEPDDSQFNGFLGGSPLARIVRGCPADLTRINRLGLEFRDESASGLSPPPVGNESDARKTPILVFCHADLLSRLARSAGVTDARVEVVVSPSDPDHITCHICPESSEVQAALLQNREALEEWGCTVEVESCTLRMVRWTLGD